MLQGWPMEGMGSAAVFHDGQTMVAASGDVGFDCLYLLGLLVCVGACVTLYAC